MTGKRLTVVLPAMHWDRGRSRGSSPSGRAIRAPDRALTRGWAMVILGPLYLALPWLMGVASCLGGLKGHGLGEGHAGPGIACIQYRLVRFKEVTLPSAMLSQSNIQLADMCADAVTACKESQDGMSGTVSKGIL